MRFVFILVYNCSLTVRNKRIRYFILCYVMLCYVMHDYKTAVKNMHLHTNKNNENTKEQ